MILISILSKYKTIDISLQVYTPFSYQTSAPPYTPKQLLSSIPCQYPGHHRGIFTPSSLPLSLSLFITSGSQKKPTAGERAALHLPTNKEIHIFPRKSPFTRYWLEKLYVHIRESDVAAAAAAFTGTHPSANSRRRAPLCRPVYIRIYAPAHSVSK